MDMISLLTHVGGFPKSLESFCEPPYSNRDSWILGLILEQDET